MMDFKVSHGRYTTRKDALTKTRAQRERWRFLSRLGGWSKLAFARNALTRRSLAT
jgi:hypothetical protein